MACSLVKSAPARRGARDRRATRSSFIEICSGAFFGGVLLTVEEIKEKKEKEKKKKEEKRETVADIGTDTVCC